jgi:hypothetical protein
VDAEEGLDRRVDAGQLQRGHPVGERAAARAARSVVRQAGDAEAGEAGHELMRELGPRPVVVDDRLDVLLHVLAHLVQPCAVLVLEQQLEAEEVGAGGVTEIHGWSMPPVSAMLASWGRSTRRRH